MNKKTHFPYKIRWIKQTTNEVFWMRYFHSFNEQVVILHVMTVDLIVTTWHQVCLIKHCIWKDILNKLNVQIITMQMTKTNSDECKSCHCEWLKNVNCNGKHFDDDLNNDKMQLVVVVIMEALMAMWMKMMTTIPIPKTMMIAFLENVHLKI